MIEEEIKKEIKQLIEKVKKEVYTPEYQNKATNEETLGVIIAKYLGWDGHGIIEVTSSALEDSNFHTLNEQVLSLIGE